jgi:hypothetical protein
VISLQAITRLETDVRGLQNPHPLKKKESIPAFQLRGGWQFSFFFRFLFLFLLSREGTSGVGFVSSFCFSFGTQGLWLWSLRYLRLQGRRIRMTKRKRAIKAGLRLTPELLGLEFPK